jgi:aspartyl protease family protein
MSRNRIVGAGLLLLTSFLGSPGAAFGNEVALAGVFGTRAALVVNGGPVRTLAIGERTPEGVMLLELSGDAALVDVGGRTRRIVLGGSAVSLGGAAGAAETSLVADARGHHFASGSINGAAVRFLVDTGASMVSIGLSDARRAGIDYRSGTPGRAQTASGTTRVWRVRLDSVRVGDVSLSGVEALVHENELPFVLLGMSFLNRMDMQREGDRLVLRKRY